MTDLLLGYDVGTSSVKVGIFSLTGDVVAQASAAYPVHRPRPGHVEQDPDDYWHATIDAIRQALAALPARAGRIAGIGCCGQAPTLILLDREHRPVRPAIIWQDTRAAAEAARLATASDAAGRAPVDASSPVARLLWLARHEPATLARAQTLISAKDYVTSQLTGQTVADYWTSRGLFSQVPVPGQPIPPLHPGVDPALVPPCLFAHEEAGRVTAAAAAMTGLPAGIPVAAGWSDGLAACLGTGALAAPDLGLDISGTSEMIGLCAPEPPRATRLLTAPIPGATHWAVFGPTQTSGAALDWACRLISVDLSTASILAEQVPAGSDGLVFLPYLEGERAPIWDPGARGLLFGLSSAHTSAHMVRAVLEGVACSVRHVLSTAEIDTGRQAQAVRTAGGATRLPLWNQIKADVTGRQFLTVPTPDVGTLGAAMLGAVVSGVFAEPGAAASQMARTGAAVMPRPDLTVRYDDLYALYLQLYPRLHDLHPGPGQD